MNTSTAIRSLAVGAAVFFCGAWAGYLYHGVPHGSDAGAGASSSPVAQGETVDQLLEQMKASEISGGDARGGRAGRPRTPWERLAGLVFEDAQARKDLLARYEAGPGVEDRSVAMVLANIESPEVAQTAVRLAGSTDPEARVRGLLLLRGRLAHTAEARALVKQVLRADADPRVLAAALAALQPHRLFVDGTLAEEMVGEFTSMAQHADPRVRSQSVLMLGRWAVGRYPEPVLFERLSDEHPEVRLSAVEMIRESNVHSPRIAARLLDTAAHPGTSPELQFATLLTLSRLPLSLHERSRAAALEEQLKPGAGGSRQRSGSTKL